MDLTDYWPTWGSSGEKPPDGRDVEGGDNPRAEYYNYFWSTLQDFSSTIEEWITDVEGEVDAVEDSLDNHVEENSGIHGVNETDEIAGLSDVDDVEDSLDDHVEESNPHSDSASESYADSVANDAEESANEYTDDEIDDLNSTINDELDYLVDWTEDEIEEVEDELDDHISDTGGVHGIAGTDEIAGLSDVDDVKSDLSSDIDDLDDAKLDVEDQYTDDEAVEAVDGSKVTVENALKWDSYELQIDGDDGDGIINFKTENGTSSTL